MSKTARRDSAAGRLLQPAQRRDTAGVSRDAAIAGFAREAAQPTRRVIRSMSKPRLNMTALAAELVGDRLADRFRLVGDRQKTDLLLLTPADLEELIEDRLAEAAYDRTRDQESVPSEVVDRILAGENRIRVWRQHRGLTLDRVAEKTGIGKGYLSQLERGQRAGTVHVLQQLAVALQVEIEDLVRSRQ